MLTIDTASQVVSRKKAEVKQSSPSILINDGQRPILIVTAVLVKPTFVKVLFGIKMKL